MTSMQIMDGSQMPNSVVDLSNYLTVDTNNDVITPRVPSTSSMVVGARPAMVHAMTR